MNLITIINHLKERQKDFPVQYSQAFGRRDTISQSVRKETTSKYLISDLVRLSNIHEI